ncbi:sialate O-acetylesterase [Marinimicrobium sp. C6131]|uniref:sialate O-acetylesterase n=1 Tax=Marinimicrobium sp. C6131 TaxID=3022676 RepID=UPI00223D035E|nr:sialate O-acetylesterase [Marinimicrobium sp. C6131]UZJ43761.1 sialate O-acetylesterase [Marinimicrobium sp. C6131]
MKYPIGAFVIGAALSSAAVQAEVTLPRLISDGMVLQRDTEIRVWGWADPDEAVSVHFQGFTWQTVTADDGRWQLTLPEMKAGGPYELTVKGENTLTLENVLVGDVWLASGQSNMELTMARTKPLYAEEMAEANCPEIRFFEVPDRYQFKHPEPDLDGGEWLSVSPETLPGISAVGYFFAKDLHQQYDVPVGVINAALGGSPAEAWLSESALKAFPHHLEEAKRWRDDDLIEQVSSADNARGQQWRERRDELDPGFKNGDALWAKPDLDDSDWETVTLPGFWGEEGKANGVWWLRKTITLPEDWAGEAAFLEVGRLVDADVTYLNGERVGQTGYQYPPRWYEVPEGLLKAGENVLTVRLTSENGRPGFVEDKPYELRREDDVIDLTGEWKVKQGAQLDNLDPPTFIRWKPMGLYNGMIAPLTDYAIKGVIWYQGESNVGREAEYNESFPAVINEWRRQWEQPDQPFLFVQLANYLEDRDEPVDSDWARLREAQLNTLRVPHTGMAVAIDVGEWNDIHPLDKRTVGERLSLAAQAVAYGDDLVASGPIYTGMEVEGRLVHLNFDHTGSGLASCNGEPLAEFAIAGEDREFVWADARIEGDTVMVQSAEVRRPVAVRYAWADNPDQANLCNREGLPASPFRTDDWPRE